MGFPSIDPEEVGASGLLWLLLTYGYIIFTASGFISEGSELLLMVPSMAGFVGGVVLPLLGAIPDGAIMLFSGLGPLDKAQEGLAVGVGALAGSTIMLLALSWSLSVIAGRVDIVDDVPSYRNKHPRLTQSGLKSLVTTGVSVPPKVNSTAILMMVTTCSYFIIQIPAIFIQSDNFRVVGSEEEPYAVGAFVFSTICFIYYLFLQFRKSESGDNLDKVMMIMKSKLRNRKISLRAVLFGFFETSKMLELKDNGGSSYGAVEGSETNEDDERLKFLLRQLLKEAFREYDVNNNNTLERSELEKVFIELNESQTYAHNFVKNIFDEFDTESKDGVLSFQEFFDGTFSLLRKEYIDSKHENASHVKTEALKATTSLRENELEEAEEAEEEEEDEMPTDLLDLSPAMQYQKLKMRATFMLIMGTTLILIFSDPMVDVLGELANRVNVPPFYVSFVLAPLASNASEVLSSFYVAKRKTEKTIAVSLQTLEGAACMNNTFGLSIFMGLIIFRGLAWEFLAETTAIIFVVIAVGLFACKMTLTYFDALLISAIYPLSILLVYSLKSMGFD